MSDAALELPEVMPGTRFVLDMPEEEYHAHPALSSTGMKQMLRSPLHYRASRAHHKAKPEFDVGHAVHAKVLGVGAPIVEIPGRLLSVDGGVRTKDAKEFVADAREAGRVPLKPLVYAQVMSAVEAILQNPKARYLLEQPGYTEVSLFAQDPETGVQLRGRVDRLASVPIDLKSTTDVRVRKITSTVIDFGYDVQAAAYRHLLGLVLGIDPEPMHLIFAEKEIPHEVRVVVLDGEWLEIGHARMREAIDLFAECSASGEWPGADDGGDEIESLAVPGWYAAQHVAVTDGLEGF